MVVSVSATLTFSHLKNNNHFAMDKRTKATKIHKSDKYLLHGLFPWVKEFGHFLLLIRNDTTLWLHHVNDTVTAVRKDKIDEQRRSRLKLTRQLYLAVYETQQITTNYSTNYLTTCHHTKQLLLTRRTQIVWNAPNKLSNKTNIKNVIIT